MEKSKCCNAEVKIEGVPDFLGDKVEEMTVATCYYICTECGKPCDTIVDRSFNKIKKAWYTE